MYAGYFGVVIVHRLPATQIFLTHVPLFLLLSHAEGCFGCAGICTFCHSGPSRSGALIVVEELVGCGVKSCRMVRFFGVLPGKPTWCPENQ